MYAISEAKRRRIQELQQIDARYNFFTLAFIAQWVAGATLALSVSSPWAALPAYFLSGTALQGLAIMMHEGVHARMFDPRMRFGRLLNRWVGVVLAMPILFSFSAYRASHLHHHRHERSIEDMDEWENFTREPQRLKLLVVAWLLVGAWLYPVHTAYHGFRVADREARRDMLLEYALLIAAFGAFVHWAPSEVVLRVWVFPAMVTAVITQVRGIAEHLFTPGDEPMRATRTVVSNRLVSAMMANLNFHLEHHMFPSVPWYRLRAVHELLKDDYRAAGACVETSYSGFLWSLLRVLFRPVAAPGPIPDERPRSYYPHYMPVLPGDGLAARQV